jgi:hypothetical protein
MKANPQPQDALRDAMVLDLRWWHVGLGFTFSSDPEGSRGQRVFLRFAITKANDAFKVRFGRGPERMVGPGYLVSRGQFSKLYQQISEYLLERSKWLGPEFAEGSAGRIEL